MTEEEEADFVMLHHIPVRDHISCLRLLRGYNHSSCLKHMKLETSQNGNDMLIINDVSIAL
eukprot:scaffold5571_cov78-Skeletonema_dohrnii-CCMP3373.AAC.3